MPRKDGTESLREAKFDPHLRGVPVVVLTASSAGMDTKQSDEQAASSYIVNPGRPALMRGFPP